MNTPLANLARQSAIKTDHGNAPPPLDFRDDTSSGDAFSMDCVSDSDSSDIQHIKQVAVKPTLDLKNVPIWDNTISTRDNAQAIKIALGSAGYLDTTKGKGTHYDHIVDTTISVATVNEKLAIIINAGPNMEARKRQLQQRVRAYTPNLNYYNPRDPQHAPPGPTSSAEGHQEAFPFVGVSPSAQHYNSMPIMMHAHLRHRSPRRGGHWSAGGGAPRGDPPPTLPLLTAAPILQLPTALVVDHLFSPCHQQQSVNRQPSPRATAPYVLVVIDD
eukprot:jgi/Tetstr1/443812/TSEL_003267.t1